jgi:trk system potassium uptake protein TrkA
VALRQLGVDNLHKVVVGVGDDLESSILTVLALIELKIPEIWAKAVNAKHGQILAAIGAHHVVIRKSRWAIGVAHLITATLMDYIEFHDGFTIANICAPAQAADRTLAEAVPRTRYGVTVVGVKRAGEDFTLARPETIVRTGDLLVVAGRTDAIRTFVAAA